MSTLENFVSPALTRALGWTLLHSLWQGALVAAVLAGALLLLRRQRAEVRYVAAAGALGAVVALAGLTFGLYFQAENRPEGLGHPGAMETTWRTELLRGQTAAPEAAAGTRPAEAAALAAEPSPANSNTAAQIHQRMTAEQPQQSLVHAFAPSLNHSLASGLRYFDRNLPLLVVAWLVGLLAMGLRMLGGLLYVQRLRRYRVHPLGAGWQERLAALAARAGLRRPVALLESALVRVPLVVGHVRPAILLPLGAVAGLPPAYLESILAHELAHVLRRDYLVNLLQTVAEVLFFYHPAVWFVARCVRAERENCCDDAATALVGGDPLRLARALAALAEWSHNATAPAAPRLALAALGGRGALLHRVRRLVQRRPAAPTLAEGILAGALVLGGLALLGSGVALAGPLAGQLRPRSAPSSKVAGAKAAVRADAVATADTIKRARPAATTGAAPGAAPKDSATMATATAPEAPAKATEATSGPGTVVVTKDKKGRLTGLVVNGQAVDAALAKPSVAERRAGRQVTVVPLPPAPNPLPAPPVEAAGRPGRVHITWDTDIERQGRRLDQKARELDRQAEEMARKIDRQMDEQGQALDQKTSRKLDKAAQKLDKAAGTSRRSGNEHGVHIEIDDAALDRLADNALALGNISINLGLEAAAQGLEEARRSLRTALKDPAISTTKRRATEQALEELGRDRDEQRRNREEAARDRAEEQRARDEQRRDQQQDERERRQQLQERIRESQRELRELDRQGADTRREGHEALVRELVKDGLVKDGGNFQLQLTTRGLVVNGKAQPAAVFEKYRKQYESQAGRKLGPTNSLVMSRNSDSRTSTNTTDNGPRLPQLPRPPRPAAVGAVPTPPAPPPAPSPDTETLRTELRRDGLISAADKNFQFQLNASGLTVNGQRQSDALAAKYRKLMGHDDGQRHSINISVQE